MKGDFNRFEEVFYRISLRKKFNDDIKRARKQLGIPNHGFFSEEDRLNWLTPDTSESLLVMELEILKEYNLPLTCRSTLSNYINFNGEKKLGRLQESSIAVIDKNPQDEEMYKEFKQPFVKLYIFDDNNLKQVQKFIKDNWKLIKDMFQEQRQEELKPIKKMRNKERDEEVFKMYQKTREELGMKKGEMKDVKVVTLLKSEYPGLTPELVRKIVSQQKKLRE